MKPTASPQHDPPQVGQRCFLYCSPSATGIVLHYDPQNGQATVRWDRPGILAPEIVQRSELGRVLMPDEISAPSEAERVAPPQGQQSDIEA